MCGLCGLIEPRSPDRAARLRAMREALKHRGPDGEGAWEDDAAALGHARLAIIDPAGGAQPMASEDGRHRLVTNGEIYNYRELRREIGGRFRTDSDTEVLLRAWLKWGPDGLERLDGMFAFAVWDARERELFAARDRLGKKPFAWRQDGDRFAFASELHALRGGPIDARALDLYLAYGYVPAPLSMTAGVMKLPPAHWLRFRAGRVETARYWSPAPQGGETESVLDRAVGKRMVGDVPVGALLSGGIDSTIVVGLMARRGPVRTFAAGFEEAEFDERKYARVAARHFGTEHTEVVVSAHAVRSLPEILRGYGEPFGDPSAVPMWVLAREAARHVKVVLSGDGGDESFGGYERYRAMQMLRWFRRHRRVARTMAPLVALTRPRGQRERVKAAMSNVDQPPADWYRDLVSIFGHEGRKALRRESGDVSAHIRDAWPPGTDDTVNAASLTDLRTYLPGDLLVKTDIASMAHGLEVRCPFLDPSVVGLGLAIPGKEKIGGRRTKVSLRAAFRDLLPPAIRRRGKQGFGVPVDTWLRGVLRDMAEDHLLDRTARERGLFEPQEVSRMLREHAKGSDDGRRLWLLLAFETWMRQASGAVIT